MTSYFNKFEVIGIIYIMALSSYAAALSRDGAVATAPNYTPEYSKSLTHPRTRLACLGGTRPRERITVLAVSTHTCRLIVVPTGSRTRIVLLSVKI